MAPRSPASGRSAPLVYSRRWVRAHRRTGRASRWTSSVIAMGARYPRRRSGNPDAGRTTRGMPGDGTGRAETRRTDERHVMTQPEGQTSRDIFPEDDGIPEISQDDFPTQDRAEDPQFAPVPGDRPGASADFGTTSREQAEGESLDDRLSREIPDDAADVRPAEDPSRAQAQLEQDLDTTPRTDSGTERTADDIEATA